MDSGGRPYALPFLGGFEHPRPQLVDIDGDGALDCFIQENSGQLELFQRNSAGAWQLRDDLVVTLVQLSIQSVQLSF